MASWGQCSKSCETGISIRQLACTKPTPKHGGKPCLGNATQFEECNTQPCPGKSQFLLISGTKYNILLLVAGGWSSWGPWGECSDSCGIAYQTRLRNCSNPKPSNGGLECEGQNEDTKQCGNPAEKCCKLSCCSEYELKSNSSLMYPKSGASKAKITPMFKCCQHLEWQNDKAACLYNGKNL